LIQQIKDEIIGLQQQSDMLEKKVATLKQYEEYLEQVMKTNSGNNDTQSVLIFIYNNRI